MPGPLSSAVVSSSGLPIPKRICKADTTTVVIKGKLYNKINSLKVLYMNVFSCVWIFRFEFTIINLLCFLYYSKTNRWRIWTVKDAWRQAKMCRLFLRLFDRWGYYRWNWKLWWQILLCRVLWQAAWYLPVNLWRRRRCCWSILSSQFESLGFAFYWRWEMEMYVLYFWGTWMGSRALFNFECSHLCWLC